MIAAARAARRRVALVIGEGGLRCAAAFGVMDVLQRAGVPIDMVVGCSGGAFCGLWVAEGAPGDAAAASRRFGQGWEGSFDRRSWPTIAKAVFPRALGFDIRQGLFDDRPLNRALMAYTGDRSFDDLKLPLYLVATDFETGDPVVISRGRLFDAIRATISMPVLLPPWLQDGRYLVDGALCDPLPVDVAIREGADVIIAIGFDKKLRSREGVRSLGDTLDQLTSICINSLSRSRYAFNSVSHHAEVVAVMPEFDSVVGLHDLDQVPRLVACGAEAAERELPYLRRLLLQPEALRG